MNLLSAENLSKSYYQHQLFNDVTLGIAQGQKVALIGHNGAGKSTLLKILAGIEVSDSGKVAVRQGVRIGYLPQHPELPAGSTIRTALFDESNPNMQLLADYEYYLQQVMQEKPGAVEKLTDLTAKIDELNLWDYEARIKQIVDKLGLPELDRKTDGLSGGQKRRIALAKMLVEPPDLILLDEPTNHLDLPAIEWLEDYLKRSTLSLLMITHDRYFLEAVTNQVIELDGGQIYKYEGSYSYFLEKKAERQQIEATGIEKARNLMRKELDWVRRQPKARGTKAKYRLDAFEDLKDKASKQINDDKVQLEVVGRRLGTKIIELEGISKSFGEKNLFKNFTYTFRRGDKVGLVGPNGAGKSTFLKIITQNLQPDTGSVVIGQTLQIGYYQQEETIFDPELRAIEVVKAVAEVITMADGSQITAGQLMQRFGFTPEQQYIQTGRLSGGQKRRLQLLRVLMENPNFLILDEPTNDLDLDTLNILEDFLANYPGCLIIVSHDRYFMDRLVEHLFIFGNQTITDYPGNYTDYRLETEEKEKANSAGKIRESKPVQVEAKSDKEKKKLSFKEQREFEQLEKEISQLEAKKVALVNKLNGGGSHEELQQWSEEIQQLTDSIEEKEMRWLELSELA